MATVSPDRTRGSPSPCHALAQDPTGNIGPAAGGGALVECEQRGGAEVADQIGQALPGVRIETASRQRRHRGGRPRAIGDPAKHGPDLRGRASTLERHRPGATAR
jgi:hypothetical protein